MCKCTYTPPSPARMGGRAGHSICFSICPTLLTAALEQTTCSPFICSAVAISPELPIISLSSSKNVGSLETQLSLAEISLSQRVVNAPIMLAFLILCYYYPRLPFSPSRIKRRGFQGPHNGSVHLDEQYSCVSALLETVLLWESDRVCPSARATQRSVCLPLER